MNIKNIADLLMEYVSKNEAEKPTILFYFLNFYHQLKSKTNDEQKKEELKNILLDKIEDNSINHLYVSDYVRKLVIMGFE